MKAAMLTIMKMAPCALSDSEPMIVFPAEPGYEVGYGRPPKETQFRKGQSGNPKGRPKGSMSIGLRLEDALNEKVEVRDSNRIRKMAKVDVMIQGLIARAMKGDQQAVSTMMRLLKETGQVRPPETEPQTGGIVAFPLVATLEELEAYAETYEYPTDPNAPDYLPPY